MSYSTGKNWHDILTAVSFTVRQAHPGELSHATVSPVCNWNANDITDELRTEVMTGDDHKLQIILSRVPESMQISSVSNTTQQTSTTDQTVMSPTLAVNAGIS